MVIKIRSVGALLEDTRLRFNKVTLAMHLKVSRSTIDKYQKDDSMRYHHVTVKMDELEFFYNGTNKIGNDN